MAFRVVLALVPPLLFLPAVPDPLAACGSGPRVGVGLTVRYGAATRQPLPRGSFGTGLVRLASVVSSIAFGYLATVFILLLYVWLSANAFLVGIQLDACTRERA